MGLAGRFLAKASPSLIFFDDYICCLVTLPRDDIPIGIGSSVSGKAIYDGYIKEPPLELTEQASDRLFILLLTALTAAQLALIYFSPLTLSPDESHYWQWSRRLDWSYYSKGPLVALLIAASTKLLGDTEFAVRLPAVLCLAAASVLWYRFVRGIFGPAWAVLSFIALRAMLIVAQSGFLMTTDAPAVLCWLAALVCYCRAISGGRPGNWLGLGFWLGLGVWAKYTVALLLPALFFHFFVSCRLPGLRVPDARVAGDAASGRRSVFGPFCALAVFAALLSPIIYWNARHGWVNLAHNAGHVVEQKGLAFRPHYLVELIGGQLAMVGPLLWLGIAYAMVVGIREWRENSRAFLFALAGAPLAALIALVSLGKRCYANWPLPIYLGGLLALIDLAARDDARAALLRRWSRSAIALSVLITAAAHAPLVGLTLGIPGKLLPSKKVVGWDEFGAYVDKLRAEYSHQAPQPVLMSDYYDIASAITFYASGHPFVFNLNLGDRRMTQYDIWTTADDWRGLAGRNVLLLVKNEQPPAALAHIFSRVTPLAGGRPCFRIVYSGDVVREVWCYYAEGFSGTQTAEPRSY